MAKRRHMPSACTPRPNWPSYTGHLDRATADRIRSVVAAYGEIPSAREIPPENLLARTRGDKKTVQGRVHYVLPTKIGETEVVSDIPDEKVLAAIRAVFP